MINCNSNEFHGEASNIQIQQVTTNSNQTITTDKTFDFDKVSEVFKQIKDNMSLLGLSRSDQEKLYDILNSVSYNVEEKTEPGLVKKAVSTVKDFLVGVSGSLAASGILYLIAQI